MRGIPVLVVHDEIHDVQNAGIVWHISLSHCRDRPRNRTWGIHQMAGVKSRRFASGEHFAALPVEIMDSDAFRWLPSFGVRVLVALAAQYRGINNGGLELTLKKAARFGIKRTELYAGLKLLAFVGLIKKTVEERKSSGKGVPAKYALTWRPVNGFLAYNIVATNRPAHTWTKFRGDARPIRSLSDAEKFLGWRKHRPRSIEASITSQTKKGP